MQKQILVLALSVSVFAMIIQPAAAAVLNETRPECATAAIEGFPRPHIGQEARARGGVAVYMAIAVIMVVSIYILCSEYFVPALEILVERLGMNSEVAGGTLMAAFGSISPFVTSVLGINVAQTDSGLSTTMGFGILKAAGIMGIAALCAGRTVRLNAWPVLTSSLYYFVAMAIVLGALMDNKIEWSEAATCLAMYVVYVIAMVFGSKVQSCVRSMTGSRTGKEDAAVEDNKAVIIDIDTTAPVEKPELESETSGWRSVAASILRPFSYVISRLVPDCRTPEWKGYFIVSIILSGILIAVCSYVLVWMLAIIGFTLGIRDSVLGLTLLSISNTLPDAISSIIVVRKGSGDMAISYILGTNIFELLVCLGLPWLMQTTVIKPGTVIQLTSSGLMESGICVLFTAILVPAMACVCRWKMSRSFSLVLLLWYFTFLTTSCLYQTNQFGEFNPPTCGSEY